MTMNPETYNAMRTYYSMLHVGLTLTDVQELVTWAEGLKQITAEPEALMKSLLDPWEKEAEAEWREERREHEARMAAWRQEQDAQRARKAEVRAAEKAEADRIRQEEDNAAVTYDGSYDEFMERWREQAEAVLNAIPSPYSSTLLQEALYHKAYANHSGEFQTALHVLLEDSLITSNTFYMFTNALKAENLLRSRRPDKGGANIYTLSLPTNDPNVMVRYKEDTK